MTTFVPSSVGAPRRSGLSFAIHGGAAAALALAVAACGSAQTKAEADLSANERDVEIVHESCDSSSSSARRVDPI